MTNDPTSAAYKDVRDLIADKLGEYSIHPQQTHVDGCSNEEDDTTCDCSYSFYFNQYPRFIEDVTKELMQAIVEAETRGRIDSYQRIMLWLEEQEDNDKLALLSKDISVELDSLFSQLQANADGANDDH